MLGVSLSYGIGGLLHSKSCLRTKKKSKFLDVYICVYREREITIFLIVQLKSLQSNSKIFVNLNLLLKKKKKLKLLCKYLAFSHFWEKKHFWEKSSPFTAPLSPRFSGFFLAGVLL